MLAAVVFMRWKASTLIAAITDTTNGFLDGVADFVLPSTPIEHRRYAQDLAERRAQLAKDEAAYCSHDSDSYDQAKCSTTQVAKDQYFADLEAFRKVVRETYSRAGAATIYHGLGDINPEFVA